MVVEEVWIYTRTTHSEGNKVMVYGGNDYDLII